jgi:hypothetical protein
MTCLVWIYGALVGGFIVGYLFATVLHSAAATEESW